jgi:hypothetical protein
MILGAPRRIRPPDANPPILLRVGARFVLIRVVFVRSRGPLVTLRGARSLSTGRGARARVEALAVRAGGGGGASSLGDGWRIVTRVRGY